MPAMDSQDPDRRLTARTRASLRASLTVAGSAMLLAACSVLEPVADEPSAAAASSSLSDPGDGRAGPQPSRHGTAADRAPRNAARTADGTALRAPTRLPDQAEPIPDADDGEPAPAHRHRPDRPLPRHRRAPDRQPAAGTVAPPMDAAQPVVTGGGQPSPDRPGAAPRDSPRDVPRDAAAAAVPMTTAADIAAEVEAALDQTEPLHPTANRPYTVANRRYYPMVTRKPFRQRGMASWYGRAFHGRKTAMGERFDMKDLSAAHPTLPLPSWVRVTNARTGSTVVVRVNDRGPFAGNRIIDLSHAAADRLGFTNEGLVAVEVELLLPGDNAQTESAD